MKTLFILFALIVIIACDTDEYYEIPDDARVIFEDGDVMVFKTIGTSADSTVVRVSHYDKTIDKKSTYERMIIDYTRIAHGVKANHSLLSMQQGPSGASVSNNGFYYTNVQQLMGGFTLSNGLSISNVYHFARNKQDALAGDVVEVYYQARYGIVRYKYVDSEYYDVQLK